MALGSPTTALDDFGVDYIELTSPAASEQSRLDCQAICKLGLKVRWGPSQCLHCAPLMPRRPRSSHVSHAGRSRACCRPDRASRV